MANTYIAIATTTVGASGAVSIDFTNIPQTYIDLKLVVSARSATGSSLQYLTVSPSNFGSMTFKNLVTEGSTTVSSYQSAGYGVGGQITSGAAPGNGATAGTFGSLELYFSNYTNAATYKSYILDSVMGNALWFWQGANIISVNAAVTSLSISAGSNLSQYSSATLYGIKNS
jgi:hypothetical protein